MRHLKILLIIFVGLLLGILISTEYETVPVQALGPACPVEIGAYFQLEEASAPYADSLGGPLATCTDCPSMVTGITTGGMGQLFNGTSNEVSVADQGQYDWGASDEFSIEYWMNSTSICTGNEVHVGRQGTTHPKPHWWVGCDETNGQVAAFVLNDKDGGDGDVTTVNEFAFGTTDITDGQWHHIVAVKDATHIRIYVDGTEEDADAKSYAAGFDSTTNLNIGFLNFSPSARYRYQGTLDELATYDKALTPTEIQQHYSAGLAGDENCSVAPTIVSTAITKAYLGTGYSYDVEATGVPKPTFSLTDSPGDMNIDSATGLITWTPASLSDVNVTVAAANLRTPDASQTYMINVSEACSGDLAAYWKLDESSSGSYADWLGAHNGSCAGACPAPTSPGRINGAQVFNGSTTGIDILADPVFDWGANDSFSIEYWINRPGQCPVSGGVLNNEVVVGRDDAGSELHWWTGISCEDQGEVRFTLNDVDAVTEPDDTATLISNTVITGGDWHHVTAVRDGGSQELKLFVNGRLESTVPATFSSGFDSANAPLNLGWLNHFAGSFSFEGTLDEVAIYNRILSPTEIKSHYHLGRGYCEGCASDIKIMPLANSIGYGNSSGVVPDESQYFISWRKDLWDTLKAGGYFVDFVGSHKAGEYYEPSGFDADNAAYPGAKPWQIYNLLNTGQPPTSNPLPGSDGPYLNAFPPDVILLHIGTNGIDLVDEPDHVANVELILDEIDEFETAQNKTIPVVLALIINQNPYHADTTTFNNLLATEVWNRVNNPLDPAYPDNIILINMEGGTESAGGDPFNYASSASQPPGDMWNILHPFETGYVKMANTWLNGDSLGSDGLVDFLPVCGDAQLIQLNAGWNMISSYISPTDPDLDVVLADIIDDMVLMKNGAGQVFWPSLPADDIHNWNPIDGYQIYMINSADLAILGTKVDPESTPIDLDAGWNNIPYLRDSAYPIGDSLSTISNELYLVKNGYGEVYWPFYSTDQIGNMLPGQGYQVYMNAADQQLIYPANTATPANVGLLSRERRSKP